MPLILMLLSFPTGLFDFQQYRAMIRSIHFRQNLSSLQPILQGFRCKEIVDSPSRILGPCLEAIGPPGIDFRPIRIKIPEGINKAHLLEVIHTGPLLIREARIFPVRLGIFQIDFLMGYIQVSAENHRLFLFQLLQVGTKIRLPFHSVIQPLQPVPPDHAPLCRFPAEPTGARAG